MEFDTTFFRSNRQRLRSLVHDADLIILTANGLLQRNSDISFPFRQDSNFWYLTGISEPDVILVIAGVEEYLILPYRDQHRIAFDGSLNKKILTDISGVSTVYDEEDGWKRLLKDLKKQKRISTLAPAKTYEESLGIYTNPARARLVQRIKDEIIDLDIKDLRSHLMRMRMIKQPAEIDAIKSAISITSQAFKEAKEELSRTRSERVVQSVFDSYFARHFVNHAYQPIIAGGVNACTLHYIQNDNEYSDGDLVLLDVGAEYSNYASDITRTYATKQPTKRQQEVYDAVIEVQEYAFGLLKPGTKIRDNEVLIEKFMGEKLKKLGLIKSVSSKAVRKFYPHATSHHLGLDTHDIADYDYPLEAGMVVTVEPGIYIEQESIGIRVEDNVLITKQGNTILTNRLSRDLF